MHQQQHYTLFKMKKVKSQSTTPLHCLRGLRTHHTEVRPVKVNLEEPEMSSLVMKLDGMGPLCSLPSNPIMAQAEWPLLIRANKISCSTFK